MDNCEICRGAKGGVEGNENIVDNIVMCDYCAVEYKHTKNMNPYVTKHKSHPMIKVINVCALIFVLVFVGWILYTMHEIHTLQLLLKEKSEQQHSGLLLEWRNIADDQEIMYHWKSGVPIVCTGTGPCASDRYFGTSDFIAIGDSSLASDNVGIGYEALPTISKEQLRMISKKQIRTAQKRK